MEAATWWIKEHKLDHFEKAIKIIQEEVHVFKHEQHTQVPEQTESHPKPSYAFLIGTMQVKGGHIINQRTPYDQR